MAARTCVHALFLGAPLGLLGLGAIASPAASGESLDEIIVTATKIPRTVDQIAGTVSVLGDAELQSQMLSDLDDIADYQPGITMNRSDRGGNQGFIIRGIGGNRVQTLVDGVRSNDIYGAGPSAYGRDLYEMDDLRGVEIIHGPASVLYGADAMGGVVLLHTKTPGDYIDGDGIFTRVRTASDSARDLLKTGLSAGFVSGDLQGLAQYTHRDYHERDVNGQGKLNPQDGNSDNLLLKGIWSPGELHEFTATADFFRGRIDTELLDELSSSVSRSIGFDESERMRLSIGHDWNRDALLADNINTQLYWQRADALQRTEQIRSSYAFVNPMDPSSYGGTLAARHTDFEFNQDQLGLDVTLQKAFSTGPLQHYAVYGLQWHRVDTVRPRNRCDTDLANGDVSCAIPSYPFAVPEVFPNKTFPDTETTRSGLFWQDEIRIGNSALTIIPGLRYERYQMEPHRDELLAINDFGFDVVAIEEDELTFNLGALFALNDNVSLFAQYAEGFRPPNYDEANQAFVNLGHGYATVPNPDLEPEYSDSIEIGLKANFASTSFNLALYDNRYDNFIESQYIGSENGISLYRDANVGEASIRGAELSSRWQASDNWRLQLAFAWSRGNNEVSDQPLDSVQPFNTVLGIGYTADSQRWGLETLVTFVADQDRVSADDRVRGESYTVLDLTAYYRPWEQLSLRAGLFNLFDEEYARWANIQGLAADNIEELQRAQEPGRNLRLNLTYQF